MIEAAVRDILLSDPNIVQCTGNRIFPLELPLNCKLPAISYFKVSDPYKQVSGFPRFQVSCWAEDYEECLNLKKAVTDTLEGFSGTVNNVTIIRIIPIDAPDFYDSSVGVYHIPIDFKVIYRK